MPRLLKKVLCACRTHRRTWFMLCEYQHREKSSWHFPHTLSVRDRTSLLPWQILFRCFLEFVSFGFAWFRIGDLIGKNIQDRWHPFDNAFHIRIKTSKVATPRSHQANFYCSYSSHKRIKHHILALCKLEDIRIYNQNRFLLTSKQWMPTRCAWSRFDVENCLGEWHPRGSRQSVYVWRKEATIKVSARCSRLVLLNSGVPPIREKSIAFMVLLRWYMRIRGGFWK